jgi:hypothetical protein
MQGIRN